jgi:hypothetical protein
MSETATAAPAAAPTLSPAPDAAPTQTQAPASPPTIETNLLTDPTPEAPVAPAEPEAPAEEAKPDAPQPVEYKDLKLPEGLATDNAMVSAFAEEASKMGLPQAQAEALLSNIAPKVMDALKAPYQAWVDTQASWQAEVMKDPEVGGSNFTAVKATVAKVLDDPRFCDPGLREALNFTGSGNNPAVIRSMYRMAKALTEGGPVVGGSPPGQAKSAAQIFYPNLS